jgi:hypothetical protein
VSDGDTGNIVRQTVDRLDVETTINTDLFRALCHSGGALAQGVRVQNRETATLGTDRKRRVRKEGGGVGAESRERACEKKGAMHARASGQERQVQLKTSFQFVSQASRCGPRLAGFLLQASAPSR